MTDRSVVSRLTLAGVSALGILSTGATAILAQSAPPTPSSAPAVSVPAIGKVKGAAAWQLLVGNTVIAKSHDGGYTEFYASEGAVQHLDRDGKATGKWSLKGEKVCFDFPEEDDRSCVDIEVDGQKGVFIDEDATRDTFDLLPGNAKNL